MRRSLPTTSWDVMPAGLSTTTSPDPASGSGVDVGDEVLVSFMGVKLIE